MRAKWCLLWQAGRCDLGSLDKRQGALLCQLWRAGGRLRPGSTSGMRAFLEAASCLPRDPEPLQCLHSQPTPSRDVLGCFAVQEQSRREQAAQQVAQAARQQADQAAAAVQSRERGLQDQQVLLQDTQRECGEYKRAADQAAEELSQEQHKRQRVQEDLVVSLGCLQDLGLLQPGTGRCT